MYNEQGATMGFKENVEVLLSGSHRSQRRLAAAGRISSGNISEILSISALLTPAAVTRITSVPRVSAQFMRLSRMSAMHVRQETCMTGEKLLTRRAADKEARRLSCTNGVPVTLARIFIPQSIAEAA
ncbi:MAG: hypothetical protein ACYDH4_02415 [Candidatus Cryosericum sp.]